MKKLLLCTLGMLCLSLQTFAQNSVDAEEPDFIGETVIVNEDGTTTPLEKQMVTITARANAGMYLGGIGGKVRQRVEIPGCCSSVRIKSGNNSQFIVRAVDNQSDPLAVITFFKMESTKKIRRAEIASTSTFGVSKSGTLDYVSFQGKKYKESSYLLKTAPLEPGEYGITVSNPNSKDEKNIVVATFAVD